MAQQTEFIPYEQAFRLKELGYDEPCYKYIYIGDTGINVDHYLEAEPSKARNYNEDSLCISQPTFSQAFRWFREKYNWHHSIEATADQHTHKLGYNYWIWNYKTGEEHYTMPKNRPVGDYEYATYEEAELACLRKLIESIKTNNMEQNKIQIFDGQHVVATKYQE